MQWSHILYNLLKVKRAIVFDCIKIFKFCKRYLVTYYTYDHHHKFGKNSLNFCLPVPSNVSVPTFVIAVENNCSFLIGLNKYLYSAKKRHSKFSGSFH